MLSRAKKVTGLDTYIPQLTGTPKQQRFTMRSDVLTSISTRQHSAISGSRLRERTVWTRILQLDRPTHSPASRTMAFTSHDSLF